MFIESKQRSYDPEKLMNLFHAAYIYFIEKHNDDDCSVSATDCL